MRSGTPSLEAKGRLAAEGVLAEALVWDVEGITSP